MDSLSQQQITAASIPNGLEMSVNPSGNPSAKRKTKSNLLRRPSFSPLSRGQDEDQDRQPTRLLQKKRPSLMPLGLTKTDKAGGILVEDVEKEYGSESPQSNRPSMLRRGRPASLFGSLRSFRMGDEETPPDTATSSKAPSVNWKDFGSGTEDTGRQTHNVQTSRYELEEAIHERSSRHCPRHSWYI